MKRKFIKLMPNNHYKSIFILIPLIIGAIVLQSLKESDRKTEKEVNADVLNVDDALVQTIKPTLQTLLSRYKNDTKAGQLHTNIRETGKKYSVIIPEAKAMIHELRNTRDIYAESIEAELIFLFARGDESRRYNDPFSGLISNDDIGNMAIGLLDSDDPFVRAMAEWAIAIRVNWLNNDPLKVWPRDTVPQWYLTWLEKRTPEFQLETDYARQAIVLGIHRSPDRLKKSAQDILNRSASLYEYISKQGDERSAGKAKNHLEELKKSCASLEEHVVNNPCDLSAIRQKWIESRRIAREIVLLNPDLNFDKILFSTRHAYHSGANITNGAKSFSIKPGGDILIKHGFSPGDKTKALLKDKLGPGHTRGIDLWWDADRVVFSWAKQPDYFKEVMYESDQGFDDWPNGLSEPALLYEIKTNGRGLRQITDHPYNSDFEPAYLPNGDIVFVSSRSDFGSQCSGHFYQNKKIVNLYRVSSDGSNIRAFSNNKDFDRYPHIMDNGLVLFTRWEYQERHLWQTHNLWICRPDGMNTDAIYKEHNNGGPMSLRDARQIPGSNKLVAIGAGHHEWAQGAVFLIDYQKGTNEPDGFRKITPFISPREGGLGNGKIIEEGGVVDSTGLYQQPYALSEKSFLVSYSYSILKGVHNATNFGLYYIDVWGNKELIHKEPVLSAVYPIPMIKKEIPPVIPDAVNTKNAFATCYVNNVYENVPEIEKGSIKYIRIAHHTEWPSYQTGERVVDFNHLHYTPSGSWARSLGLWTWCPTRVFGTVPVEEDGSAHFKVPVNLPIYFQALDSNFLEIRRMRTFVAFQPGEIRGCTGCHETRDEAPFGQYHVPVALHREPSVPEQTVWGDSILPDFEKHIQPILDRNCIGCHGEKNPKAGLEFTSRKVDCYNQSYRTMFGLKPWDPTPVHEKWSRELMYPDHENILENRDLLKQMERNEYPGQLISISNKFGDNSVTQVKEFGSTQSKLIQAILDENHQKHLNMSKEDWVSLVTWIDMNAPYWGAFVDKEPAKHGGVPKKVEVIFPPAFDTLPYQTSIKPYREPR